MVLANYVVIAGLKKIAPKSGKVKIEFSSVDNANII